MTLHLKIILIKKDAQKIEAHIETIQKVANVTFAESNGTASEMKPEQETGKPIAKTAVVQQDTLEAPIETKKMPKKKGLHNQIIPHEERNLCKELLLKNLQNLLPKL